MMDAASYGGSKASKCLVEILGREANSKYTRKVGNYYNEFTTMANALFYSNLSYEHKLVLCQIWKEKCIKNVKDSTSITDEIKRFLCNVLVMKWRFIEKFFKLRAIEVRKERSKNVIG